MSTWYGLNLFGVKRNGQTDLLNGQIKIDVRLFEFDSIPVSFVIYQEVHTKLKHKFAVRK